MSSLRYYIDLIAEATLDTQRHAYIRFGEIPQNERSGIGASPNWAHALVTQGRQQEFGVSIYDAVWDAKRQKWRIIDGVNAATLDALIADAEEGGCKIYLVTGTPVDEEHLTPEELDAFEREGDAYVAGSDGETLLRNVRIVQELTLRDLYEPNTFDPDKDLPKPPADHRMSGRVIVFPTQPGRSPEDRGEQKIEWEEVATIVGNGPQATLNPIHLTYKGQPSVLFVDEDAEMKRLPPNPAATAVVRGDGRPLNLPHYGILGTCVLMVGHSYSDADYAMPED